MYLSISIFSEHHGKQGRPVPRRALSLHETNTDTLSISIYLYILRTSREAGHYKLLYNKISTNSNALSQTSFINTVEG